VTADEPDDWEVPARGSVLVTGPSEHTLDGVVERLVATRQGSAGGLVVTTRDGTVDLHAPRHGALAAFADGAAGLVDCTPGTAAGADRDSLRWEVASPTAFTSIGMAVSDGLAALADRGVEVPWVVFDTLSTPFVSADSAAVVRFAHAIHSQVTARGGVTVFPVYTNVTTGTDLARCEHLANVHVDVRRHDGDRRFRVRGHPSAPSGWLPLESTDAVDAESAVGTPDLRAP